MVSVLRTQKKTVDSRSSRRGRRRSIRGVSLVELLIAGLLLSISMMAMVQMWAFAYRVTANTDDKGIAYNLGRQAMETVKMSGFDNAAEGSSTAYYNGQQVAQGNSATARYSVTTSVVSSAVNSGTAGQSGAVPSSFAIRTVSVTVSLVSGGTVLYQTSTYLVRAGI
jgi:Tfp pilus assembly protein PilV